MLSHPGDARRCRFSRMRTSVSSFRRWITLRRSQLAIPAKFKSRGIKGMTRLHQLSTSHGSIAVEEAGRGDLPVLLIHGNSLSRAVFRKQLGGALSSKYRLVAFDLPGHGDSGDALNASRTYTRPGLADAAIEVLGLLGLGEVVVVGWSLGGHIALEMASQFSGIRGLLICGAPPVSRHKMAEGFIPRPHMKLAGQQHLGPSEIDAFGEAIFGAPVPVAFRSAIERADGLARKTIFEAARSGAGVDQRCLVENFAVPLAVVNGSQDPFHPPRLFRGSEICESVGGALPSFARIEARAVLGSAGRFRRASWKVHRRCRCAMTRGGRRPVAAGVQEASATTATHRDYSGTVPQCGAARHLDTNRIPSIGRYTISLGEVTRCEGLSSL